MAPSSPMSFGAARSASCSCIRRNREPAPHLVGALIGQYQARPVRVESIVVECLIEQLDGADLFELEVNVAVLAGKPEILEPLPAAGSFVRRPPDQIRLGVVP